MRIIEPSRDNYKRTFKDTGGCLFCGTRDILECEGLSNEHWRLIVNRFPYMDGNVMIVPVRHIENTDELTKEEWATYADLLKKTKQTLTEVFEVDSFNVGMNIGPESGASIPHIHWQIVPRKFKNMTVMNTLADLYVISVTAEETKKRIDAHLAS